ncbi:EAL domain-containing protein [Jeotgalibacillus soli]|uniref:Diguanylate cyclase n=1 Tax=Jeotgalibacillus soli TaxID=889306 RepID=A0A0C2RU89_9BACL|nr:EAL domain-containing protein [Jeotgalibacillus soli]KIL45314.1 hypothetical protein KP78_28580 [Jeotgalibacillus soli]
MNQLQLSKWITYVILMASTAASFVYIPVFFGFELIIGSIFTFTLYRLTGFRIALIHSIIFAISSYFEWGHFFGSIAILLEFLIVSALYKRKRGSLILTDMIYWLIIGIPFVFLSYYFILEVSFVDSMVVALKFIVNGVFNMLIVNIILITIGYFFIKKEHRKIKLDVILFNTILSFLLIPTLLWFTYESRLDFNQTLERMGDQAENGYVSFEYELEHWLDEITRITAIQGNILYDESLTEEEAVRYLSTLQQSVHGVQEIVLINQNNDFLYGFPENREKLTENTILPPLKRGEIGYSSFHFDSKTNRPFIYMTIPIYRPAILVNQSPLFVAISVDLSEWEEFTSDNHTVDDLNLLDQSGNWLFVPDNEISMSKYAAIVQSLPTHQSASFLWREDHTLSKILSWEQSSHVVTASPDQLPWTIAVSVSTKPFKDEFLLEQLYRLMLIVITMALTIFLSNYLSKLILRPMDQLVSITQDLPDRVQDGQHILWPQSELADIQYLIRNFKKMTGRLSSAFREVQEQQRELSLVAKVDPLTSLSNRLGVEQRFHEFQLLRNNQGELGIIFMDLDHFKKINDTLGHGVGDEVLKEVASRLSASIVDRACVGRLGGDEFISILPDTNSESLIEAGHAILTSFEKPFEIGGQSLSISPSIGLALSPSHGEDFNMVVQHADMALYESKNKGRNQATMFDHSFNANIIRRRALEKDLRHAIQNNQLKIHFIPIHSLQTDKVTAVEAILHWHHKSEGVIPSIELRTLAKETHLAQEIGRYIIEKSIEKAKLLHDQGYKMDLAINLMIEQCYDHQMVETLHQQLLKNQYPPSKIRFEMSESLKSEEMDFLIDTFNQLRKLGAQLVLDDFGTGYASLNNMKDLQLHAIKIDQHLLKGVPENIPAKRIINGLVSIAKSMSLSVVADGVKSEEQLAYLSMVGCEEAQGPFYSKPISLQDTIAYLKSNY